MAPWTHCHSDLIPTLFVRSAKTKFAFANGRKEAAAFEAPGQTKEEFSGNDTSRHPKVFKLGPKLGYQ